MNYLTLVAILFGMLSGSITYNATQQGTIDQLRAENQQLKEQLDKTCTAYCDYQLPE
jgi:hypothetical protein